MIAYLMGAALIGASLASPASAAETLTKQQCPPGQVDYSTDGSMICGTLPIDLGFSKPLNCKVGEVPVWVTKEGLKCETVRSITGWPSGTITSRVPECPDGWHLVLTQSFAPMCAWVLREPTN